MSNISKHIVRRLILYRKILQDLLKSKAEFIYSHKLASLTGNTPAQVRRDLMMTGYKGTPTSGYNIKDLIKSISEFLDNPEADRAVLAGLGHLGRAILNYTDGIVSPVKIAAAFDKKQEVIGRVMHKVMCYDVEEMESYIRTNKIKIGIITVPSEESQKVADKMVQAGITSILNFTSTRIKVPVNVYVDNIDMTISLENASFFATKKF